MIRWSAGHIRITGKESSARRVFSDTHDLPRSLLTKGRAFAILPIRKSALKQLFNNVIKNEARELTRTFPCYSKFRSVEPSTPSKPFASIINELTRRHNSESHTSQLKTGLLNKHLHAHVHALSRIHSATESAPRNCPPS